MEYKRVDPLYKSLGTYYFQEDYENYTFKLNFKLLQGKIRFNGKGGLQLNNLSKLRSFTSSRQIANVNLTIIPSRIFTANLRYSNFQTERSPELSTINDTVRLTNTTAVYGMTTRYSFGETNVSAITLTGNYQNLVDLLNDMDTGRSIDNYTGNLSFSQNFREKAMQLSASLLFNQNLIADRETQRIGANIRWSIKFLEKKLSLNAGGGYIKNTLNGTADGDSYTGRVGVKYKMNKSFYATLNTNYLYRTKPDGASQEIRGVIKFNYTLPKIETSSKANNKGLENIENKTKPKKEPKIKEPKVKNEKPPKVKTPKEKPIKKEKEVKAKTAKEKKPKKTKESKEKQPKEKKEKKVKTKKEKAPKPKKEKKPKEKKEKKPKDNNATKKKTFGF